MFTVPYHRVEYGYPREYAVERFARDVRLLTIGGDASGIMKEITAKELKL